MVRSILLAVVASGVFLAAAGVCFTPDASGDQWYPFYGYHRPSYLDEPGVVSQEPAEPQVSTANYPPAQDTEDQAAPTSSDRACSPRWYPFYGYHRPSYLD